MNNHKYMKFVSKYDNYRVVLKNGVPAGPITGRQAVPGLSVRFEGGTAIINDDNIVDMLLKHEGYNRDFFLMTEKENDQSFMSQKKGLEPEHDLIEMNYGRPGKNLNPSPSNISPETKELILSTAKEMAKNMAKDMVKEILSSMATVNKKPETTELSEESEQSQEIVFEEKIIDKPELTEDQPEKKKSPGRPKKVE